MKNAIKKARLAAGLTQEELGAKIGVTGQAVSKWECGETLPDTALLISLSDALSTSTDVLLGQENRFREDVYKSLEILFRQNEKAIEKENPTVAGAQENQADANPNSPAPLPRFTLGWEMLWNLYRGFWNSEYDENSPMCSNSYTNEDCAGRGSRIVRDTGIFYFSHDEKVPFFCYFPGDGEKNDWDGAFTPDKDVLGLFAAMSDEETMKAANLLWQKELGYTFELPVLLKNAGIPEESAEKVRDNLLKMRMIFKQPISINGTPRMLYHYRVNELAFALWAIAVRSAHPYNIWFMQSDRWEKNKNGDK